MKFLQIENHYIAIRSVKQHSTNQLIASRASMCEIFRTSVTAKCLLFLFAKHCCFQLSTCVFIVNPAGKCSKTLSSFIKSNSQYVHDKTKPRICHSNALELGNNEATTRPGVKCDFRENHGEEKHGQ